MAAHMKKTEWDNIPEWAIYALEYGTEEDGSLNEAAIPHLESLARPARFFLFHHKYTEK